MSNHNNDNNRVKCCVNLTQQNAIYIPPIFIESIEDDKIEEEIGKMIDECIKEQELQQKKEQEQQRNDLGII